MSHNTGWWLWEACRRLVAYLHIGTIGLGSVCGVRTVRWLGLSICVVATPNQRINRDSVERVFGHHNRRCCGRLMSCTPALSALSPQLRRATELCLL